MCQVGSERERENEREVREMDWDLEIEQVRGKCIIKNALVFVNTKGITFSDFLPPISISLKSVNHRGSILRTIMMLACDPLRVA